MVALTLPDGSTREFDGPVTGGDLARSIGARLSRDALAVVVDGVLKDTSEPITADATVEIVTRTHKDAAALLRHDCAHVMAEAVQRLFPGTQVTFGPATETGFYYDFARDVPFSSDDLEEIESEMHAIIARNEPFQRQVWGREDAKKFFATKGEKYKVEHIDHIPGDEELSLYSQGDWADLCRGPHAPSTGHIGKAFKLLKVSGAYWRGDANNDQLQRIYGTCWPSEKELKAYLLMLEEAEKRDHRRLGRELGLFHLQEEAAGSVFWHPKGWAVYRALEDYMRLVLKDAGYQEVRTPQLIDRTLWEKSGHWEKFRDAMFSADSEHGRVLAVKPMNCPGHVQIFRQGQTSYRDLPLRMAEFGNCHRNEPSGALHGLMRVRNFVQDDAHIFCTEDQINSETVIFCDLLKAVYRDLGFDDIVVKFSDRPPTRAGSDETWDKAESALREAVEEAGLSYCLNPGEGAFYGPKLEFVLRDAIGRDWQCGTLQVDFVLPERLDAVYTGEDDKRHRPVILHRAILGSFERFLAILIEQYAGKFPFWMAPVQVVVASVTTDANDYADHVRAVLQDAGLRVHCDMRNEKIGYKVREHSVQKIPVLLAVGRREAEDKTVALRRLGSREQVVLPLDELCTQLVEDSRSPAQKRQV